MFKIVFVLSVVKLFRDYLAETSDFPKGFHSLCDSLAFCVLFFPGDGYHLRNHVVGLTLKLETKTPRKTVIANTVLQSIELLVSCIKFLFFKGNVLWNLALVILHFKDQICIQTPH